MLVLVIALAVAVVIAVSGYITYRVVGAIRSAAHYGTITVPGEVAVELPAGSLKLSYQESYRAQLRGGVVDFGVPNHLAMTVTSPSGEPLEVTGPGVGGRGRFRSQGPGWTRAVIGTVAILHPGVYVVRADMDPGEHVEPQVLLGK